MENNSQPQLKDIQCNQGETFSLGSSFNSVQEWIGAKTAQNNICISKCNGIVFSYCHLKSYKGREEANEMLDKIRR